MGRIEELSLCVLMTSLLLVGMPCSAAAHPYQGLQLEDIPGEYGVCQYPPEADFAEIRFTHDFPPPETLSPAEQFVVAGSLDAPGSPDVGLQPWWQYVVLAVRSYYSKYGHVPPALSQDILEDLYGNTVLPSPDWLEMFKSPLTDQFPRLDALQNSPGDLYIRELSEPEIADLSQYDLSLHTIYYEHRFYPNGMYADPELRSTQPYENVTHVSPVFFVRVHGWNGVIWEVVSFTWSVEE